MSDQKSHTWARTFEIMAAVVVGALASRLFDNYWAQTNLTSQLIVGGFTLLIVFLVALTFVLMVNLLDKLADKRNQKTKEKKS